MIEVNTCPACLGTGFEAHLRVADFRSTREEFDLKRCLSCGLIVTSPRPEDEDLAKYYPSEDYISHSNKARGPMDWIYKLVRSRALGMKRKWVLTQTGEPGTLLDYGAGNGAFAHHCKNNGWEVQGVELSESARQVANRDFGLHLVSPEEALNGGVKGNLDAITLWHVLEHLPDPSQWADRFSSWLKPGGTLVIAVPNPGSYDAAHYSSNWAAYDVPLHLWHFSPRSLDLLLEPRGFQRKATIGMPFDSYYVSMLSEKKKGSSLAPLKGFLTGWRSNRAAKTSGQWSSLVHVFKKA